jgi:hypothetical protein
MTPMQRLHQDCAALGTLLFTVTSLDPAAGLSRRAYTSHPRDYPLQGTKPLERDAWYDLCFTRALPFVANTPAAFRDHFFDHALIESLGLGSACNLPLVATGGPMAGTVIATVNLLAEEGHFTENRLTSYQALVSEHGPALIAGL